MAADTTRVFLDASGRRMGVSLTDLREQLALQGLHVVTAAERARLATAVGLLDRALVERRSEWADDVRRFVTANRVVSAQPAAPDADRTYEALMAVKDEPAAPTRTEAEHVSGCRYEREYPALDPEDCPRCASTLIEAEPTSR